MLDRKFKRVRLESQAMVIVGDHYFEGLTDNISLNGLFIRTGEQIPVGKRAAISLNLPSASRNMTVTLNGEVVRNDSRGLAFQFKSLDYEVFSYLKTIITRKMPGRQRECFNA